MRGLDFRFNVGSQKIGAPFHGLKAFFTTPQLALLDKVSCKPVSRGWQARLVQASRRRLRRLAHHRPALTSVRRR